jgi:hypothetical protein
MLAPIENAPELVPVSRMIAVKRLAADMEAPRYVKDALVNGSHGIQCLTRSRVPIGRRPEDHVVDQPGRADVGAPVACLPSKMISFFRELMRYVSTRHVPPNIVAHAGYHDAPLG